MDVELLINVIIIAAVIHGVFLALVLQLLNERNKSANKILSGILIVSVLMLLGKLVFTRFSIKWLWYLGVFAETIMFIIGPLLYLYIWRLLYKETAVQRLSWKHYILAMIHIVYSIWFVSLSQETKNQLFANNTMGIIFFISEMLGILSLGFYLYKGYLLHRKYKKEILNHSSFLQSSYAFIKVILFVLSACLFFWICSFINAYFVKIKMPLLTYNNVWIVISIFIYCVGYYSLRQPEIFRISIVNKPALDKNRLSPEAIRQLQKRLTYFVVEEEVYIDSSITLKSLSEKLNTTTNNLSWLLNNVYNVSFYEYINELRIDKFLQKVNAGAHHKVTLLSLALDVGFNSKSTFNKVFKSKIGTTPSAYIKQKSTA